MGKVEFFAHGSGTPSSAGCRIEFKGLSIFVALEDGKEYF